MPDRSTPSRTRPFRMDPVQRGAPPINFRFRKEIGAGSRPYGSKGERGEDDVGSAGDPGGAQRCPFQ
eukprot:scaffold287_cov337-Pavlova_lutheri.AAC.183